MINAPVSVIITTYNDADYLSDAIESVFNQKLLPTQLIVIDDGSDSDKSSVITSRYMQNNKEIRVSYFKKENGGVSSARNLGIRYADQPYISFLDADDRMLKDNLELKYNSLNVLSDSYFGVYGSAVTSKGNHYDFRDINGIAPTSLVGFYKYGIPGGCQYYLFRTKSIKNIGGFDESLSNNEDFDLIIRMIVEGQSCKGVIGCSTLITLRENSLSRDTDYYKVFNNIMKFIDKAEKNNFFSQKHLNKRKSIAHLSLAKRVFYKDPITATNLVVKAVSYTKNPYDLYRIYKER